MSTDVKIVNTTIAVPFRRIGKEKGAIEYKLNLLISQYMPEADGVLLKWEELEILNDKGIIIDDQPYSFWKIRFRAHVFTPIEGKLIKAQVQQILKQFFIVKAFKSFTATVAIPDKLADHDIIKSLSADQEVYFRIIGSSEGAYRGEIDDECIEMTSQLMKMEQDASEDVYGYAKDFEY